MSIDGMDENLAEKLVGEGFLSYDDLSVIEPDALMAMGNLSQDAVDHIVAQAETKAEEAEQAASDQRRRQREQQRIDAATAALESGEAVEPDFVVETGSAEPEAAGDSSAEMSSETSALVESDTADSGVESASGDASEDVVEEEKS